LLNQPAVDYNTTMTNNWDMLGHEWAVELLTSHLKRGAPRHAYLFTGPQGIGRRTLALRFAQAINAENPSIPGDFDPNSPTSRQFEKMQHPDLSVIKKEEGSRDIKIDAIRALQKAVALSPYTAKNRIALLLNYEEASRGAANALLKTLEEPPGNLVLLLTAESPEMLLPTIVSRCEVMRLRPVSIETVSAGLQKKWDIPAKEANFLAHVSSGRPGYALFLHQNPQELETRTAWLNDHNELLHANRVGRFSYAQNIAKNKNQFTQLLFVWLSYWRDVLLQSGGTHTPLSNIDRQAEIMELANSLEPSAATNIIKVIERTIALLRKNINVRLAAEILLLELPNI
jgi:DNA polymerase-3 subunit delta'